MKKTSLFLVMAIIALVSLSSCDKEVVSTPITVTSLPKATITGYVQADLNLKNAGNEIVPIGTILLVSIPNSQLITSATGTWQQTVTVDATGKYSVTVPATPAGVTVTITPVSFEASQTSATSTLVPGRFDSTPYTLTSVVSLQTVLQNITYNFTQVTPPNK